MPSSSTEFIKTGARLHKTNDEFIIEGTTEHGKVDVQRLNQAAPLLASAAPTPTSPSTPSSTVQCLLFWDAPSSAYTIHKLSSSLTITALKKRSAAAAADTAEASAASSKRRRKSSSAAAATAPTVTYGADGRPIINGRVAGKTLPAALLLLEEQEGASASRAGSSAATSRAGSPSSSDGEDGIMRELIQGGVFEEEEEEEEEVMPIAERARVGRKTLPAATLRELDAASDDDSDSSSSTESSAGGWS